MSDVATVEPPVEPVVRLGQESDLPRLQVLDAWPKEAAWLRMIANQEVVVLEVDHTVVGVAHYSVLWTTVPFLNLMVIEPEHHGFGYSRMLLGCLIEHLRAQGFVALLSSSQTNEPEPQAWHMHMGFKSNGIIENIADDGVGELVFRLELASWNEEDARVKLTDPGIQRAASEASDAQLELER